MRRLKLTLATVATLISTSSAVNAASYSCEAKSNGYSHAANAAQGDNFNKKLEVVRSWIPDSFTITPEELTFRGRNPIPVTSGDREKSFVANNRGRDVNNKSSRNTYRVTVNPYDKKGLITMQSRGYKDMGPVFFSCVELSSSGKRNVGNVSADKTAFLALSQCQRKYVQQFLKGQGFYNSSIDGKWGAGTQKGLEKLRSLKQFKGRSSEEVMKILKNNPMC